MKRTLELILLLLMSITCSVQAQETWTGNYTAATSFGGGSGTEEDPYLITSIEEWIYFSRQDSWTDKYYQLDCDIYVPGDVVNGFPCVGNKDKYFDGTFDGNGHHVQISKYMNHLFGFVTGTIKNLAFSAIRESPNSRQYLWYQGCIVQSLERGGVVDNCYLYYSGSLYDGLSAFIFDQLKYGSTVSNTYISGSATYVESPGKKVLASYNGGCTFINCHSTYNGTPSTWTTNSENYQNCDDNVITRAEWRQAIRGNADFTVKYHDESGYSACPSETYSEATTITLPVPTSECTFSGWYNKGSRITTSTVSVDGDTDFYARWSRNVISQPTNRNPTFAIQDASHANFQWYKYSSRPNVNYGSWTSTNTAHDSESRYTYTINATVGQTLYLKWWVSSEDYDKLIIYINGVSKFSYGGINSGTFTYSIPSTGTYSVTVAYEKDESDSEGSDQARITSCYLAYDPEVVEGATNATISSDILEKDARYYCVATYTNSFANVTSEPSYKSNDVTITNIYAESILLDKSELEMSVGDTYTFTTTIAPSNTTNRTLNWTSSNNDIATVDANGLVTAIATGTVRITATTTDGTSLSTSCDITVSRGIYRANLIDGEPYTNTRRITYDELTFSKTFVASAAGNWNAFYVPMCINVEDYAGELDFAEIYAFCSTVDTNGDGTVDANDERFLFVRPLASGRTYPNTPYLIRPREAKTYVINSTDNILYEKRDGQVVFSTTREAFTVTGLNENFTIVANDNNYYVTSSGKLSIRTSGSVNVKPNRWIMHREDRDYSDIPEYVDDSNHLDNDENGESGAKNYRIIALGEDISETDAIIAVKNAQGVFTSGLYTIDGRKVNDCNNTPAGVYIKNGRKVIVK